MTKEERKIRNFYATCKHALILRVKIDELINREMACIGKRQYEFAVEIHYVKIKFQKKYARLLKRIIKTEPNIFKS